MAKVKPVKQKKCGWCGDTYPETENCPNCDIPEIDLDDSNTVDEDGLSVLADLAEEIEEETDISELEALVDDALEYQDMKDVDFSETDEMKAMVEFVGEKAPIKFLEDLLAHYKKKYYGLVNTEIPEMMQSLGLKDSTLENGHTVKMKEVVSTSTLDETALDEWLVEHDYADNIKETLEFTKGEKALPNLIAALTKKGISFKKKGSIHYQTLNRIIRERLEEGVPEGQDESEYEILPSSEILSVTILEQAKIK